MTRRPNMLCTGRDVITLGLFVVAALVVWAILASRTTHRAEHEPTDHEVHIISREDSGGGTLAAMCTRCEWNDLSAERDRFSQEHDLRVKAKWHSRNVSSSIVVVEPGAEEAAWDSGRHYLYRTVVTHGERRWQARWLNRAEEPGVSEAWEELPA